jgi:UDP-2,3-diacylglucosamine pyrophosphatase LpxH
MKDKQHYRTVVLSDLHLGAKSCQHTQIEEFLDHFHCDFLYLNGDIIDGWALRRKWKWNNAYNGIIKKILKKSQRGTKVVYVLGNHDDFLRAWLDTGLKFGNISIVNEAVHQGVSGESYLVTHGDLFDGVSRLAPWISWTGAKGYELLINCNTLFNQIRKFFGLKYWSFSAWLKHNVKKAVDHIFRFEHNLSSYCRSRRFSGVICGHIHTAEIKQINGVAYLNSGDWQESCTALVEHEDGQWEIIHWRKQKRQ